MGFGFGFRFGLGSGGASAPSPPTALTLTLPAISDETVDCTATFSADAEKCTVVPHGDPAPVYGVGTWTNVGETHIHTTALSGAIELDAYGWSAAGGGGGGAGAGANNVGRSGLEGAWWPGGGG